MWRYTKCKTALWRRIIQQKFKVQENLLIPTDDRSAQCKSLWKNVLKEIPVIQNHSEYEIKDGRAVNFWNDKCIGSMSLKEHFLVIYKACRHKNIAVADMIQNGRWECPFRRILNANEQLEWDLLRRDVQVPVLQEGEDSARIMDNFTTKRCYELLAGNFEECDYVQHVWKKNIPPKVSFTTWILFQNSRPTRVMLSRRGINIQTEARVLCNAQQETDDHLMLQCMQYGCTSLKRFGLLGSVQMEFRDALWNGTAVYCEGGVKKLLKFYHMTYRGMYGGRGTPMYMVRD